MKDEPTEDERAYVALLNLYGLERVDPLIVAIAAFQREVERVSERIKTVEDALRALGAAVSVTVPFEVPGVTAPAALSWGRLEKYGWALIVNESGRDTKASDTNVRTRRALLRAIPALLEALTARHHEIAEKAKTGDRT